MKHECHGSVHKKQTRVAIPTKNLNPSSNREQYKTCEWDAKYSMMDNNRKVFLLHVYAYLVHTFIWCDDEKIQACQIRNDAIPYTRGGTLLPNEQRDLCELMIYKGTYWEQGLLAVDAKPHHEPPVQQPRVYAPTHLDNA